MEGDSQYLLPTLFSVKILFPFVLEDKVESSRKLCSYGGETLSS